MEFGETGLVIRASKLKTRLLKTAVDPWISDGEKAAIKYGSLLGIASRIPAKILEQRLEDAVDAMRVYKNSAEIMEAENGRSLLWAAAKEVEKKTRGVVGSPQEISRLRNIAIVEKVNEWQKPSLRRIAEDVMLEAALVSENPVEDDNRIFEKDVKMRRMLNLVKSGIPDDDGDVKKFEQAFKEYYRQKQRRPEDVEEKFRQAAKILEAGTNPDVDLKTSVSKLTTGEKRGKIREITRLLEDSNKKTDI